MQADQIQVLVQQSAAGHTEAFLTLVQEFAPGLRLVLGAHLDQPGALPAVESAVWILIRARLGEYLPPGPFAEWIRQVAVEPLTAHLKQADRRAIDLQDALAHQNIQACLEALLDGRERQVEEVRARFAALPEATRGLLQRRYRDRHRCSDIAASLMISEGELATTMAGARAACDWRQLARPPAAGDRLLPPLIEDWLNGTIDVDSRSLLAANLVRDLERAGQFARQVRVHLVLGALLTPFGRSEALTLARPGGMGDSARVMMGPSPRSLVPARTPASEMRRATRGGTSGGASLADDDGPAKSSPLPWIIAGVMVVLGIGALMFTSTRGGAPARPFAAPTAVPTSLPAANGPAEAARVPATGGVLRVQPGVGTVAQPKVVLVGIAAGMHAYVGVPLELRAQVVGVPDLTEVEYRVGDLRIGSAREIPFSLTWTPTRPGVVQVSARALAGNESRATSESAALTIVAPSGSGHLTREWWTGLPGSLLAEGLAALPIGTPPTGRVLETRFGAPRNWEDSYLQRLSGWIIPPLDGEYVFWISADDEAELWLSTDDSRERRQRIAMAAYIPGIGIGHQVWEQDPRQRSAPIRLRAGQRYYCEALHKEGIVHDHLDVGWQLPDGVLERPISGLHLMPLPDAPIPSAHPVAVVPLSPPSPPSPLSPPTVVPSLAVPVPAVIPVVPTAAGVRRPDLMIWDGEGANGGAGYRGFGAAGQSALEVVAQGRAGAGLRARLGGGNAANVGWNWHAWSSDQAGSDLSSYAALALWVRFSGPAAPANVVMRLACSPREPNRRSRDINLTAREPRLLDGAWHQVVVPLVELAPPGHDFDATRAWELSFDIFGGAMIEGVIDFDEIGMVRSLVPSPVSVLPGNSPWRVVRAINLGGEAVEIDGQRWQGHRQAEAEGETAASSLQPGAWLSDLPWLRATTAVDSIRRDLTMQGRPLSVGGKIHAKGLGVHANSEIVYALDGRQPGFTAEVGVNDGAGDGKGGEVIFQVWGDGQKLWDSGVVNNATPAKAVSVSLLGRHELRLVVDTNGPSDADQADWCSARFLRPGGDDGTLMVKAGRRVTANFAPKPAVDVRMRSVLGTALVGSKDGLAFAVRVPNGPTRVWLWVGESGSGHSRQFDLDVEGAALAGIGSLPEGGWEKLGPLEMVVADGTLDVTAKAIKGIPQVMGIVIEQIAP